MSAPTFDRILADHATLVDLSRDRLVLLDDPRQFTLVADGEVDLFAVPVEDGRPNGRWNFLGRIARGGIIVGAPRGPRHSLLARPVIGSTLYTLPARRMESLSGPTDGVEAAAADLRTLETVATEPDPTTPDPVEELGTAQLVAGLEQVIVMLAKSMRTQLPPRDFVPLSGTATVTATKGQAIRSVDGVRWVEVLDGEVEVADGVAGQMSVGERICLTERDWLLATPRAVVRGRSTRDLLAAHELWAQLIVHTARTLYTIDRRVEKRDADERRADQRRRDLDHSTMASTATRFETLLRDTDARLGLADIAADPPALAATRLVGSSLGFEVTPPRPGSAVGRDRDSVNAIAIASGARTRTIRLDGTWWRRDLGPMIAYHGPKQNPVALLRVGGRYIMADAGRVVPVTPKLAESLTNKATVLYPPLPRTVRSVWALLRFGIAGNSADLWRFGMIALLVAVVGLLSPIMTGAILGTFVARAQTNFIVQGAILVMAAAFLVAALSVVQNIAVLRIESRSTERMQAGMWTRLLSLPATFFGRYSTGALGTTVLGVNAAQEMLSGVVTTATLGLIVGVANLVLVFFIDLRLALVATGLLLVALVAAGVTGWIDIRRQRAVYENEQTIASRVFQLLTAVPKLRVAAAEDRAFGVWAEQFTRGRTLAASSRRVQNTLATFNAGFPIACSIVIFAMVGGPLHDTVSVTTFLSFFAAFSLLIASILQFTGAAITAVGIVPMFQKLRPIIEAEPEIDEAKADPGDLSGRVALTGVTFRYGDGPVVLDDVSISIDVGEFVAVVGPSGSGKSTILRLLLGFETPSSGTVLYDGQDLAELEVSAVRRQCGVVLQNGALLAGDIKTNIIGSTTHTVDDAWTAAGMAGIEEDIRAMPMGMNTVLSEGASALSGGQRQRIMIARALVGRPRLVLFDEATSALDNPTQQMVAESTRRLNASRVVIAHRLSTIANADKIVVLDKGRVVQQGTYDELLADPDGVFAVLARRQM